MPSEEERANWPPPGASPAEPPAADAAPQHQSARPWSSFLEEWTCALNIERFRQQLAEATDERLKLTLARLLAEHEATLARLTASQQRHANSAIAPQQGTESKSQGGAVESRHTQLF